MNLLLTLVQRESLLQDFSGFKKICVKDYLKDDVIRVGDTRKNSYIDLCTVDHSP